MGRRRPYRVTNCAYQGSKDVPCTLPISSVSIHCVQTAVVIYANRALINVLGCLDLIVNRWRLFHPCISLLPASDGLLASFCIAFTWSYFSTPSSMYSTLISQLDGLAMFSVLGNALVMGDSLLHFCDNPNTV